jgi:hypothetical protein
MDTPDDRMFLHSLGVKYEEVNPESWGTGFHHFISLRRVNREQNSDSTHYRIHQRSETVDRYFSSPNLTHTQQNG